MALRRAVSCALALCAVGSAAAFVLPVTVPARLSPAAAGRPRAAGGVGLLGDRRKERPQTQGRRQGLVGLRAEADFYADLGVSRGTDEKEIKSAFRNKARKLHPDVNKAPDAQQQFQKIQLAYEVLSDPQKKSMYDRWDVMALRKCMHVCVHVCACLYLTLAVQRCVCVCVCVCLFVRVFMSRSLLYVCISLSPPPFLGPVLAVRASSQGADEG